MEQDQEITAESVLRMVRTQTNPAISQEAAEIQTNSAARIVELFRGRFGKAIDAGIWKRLSNVFLEPANPFDVKARRQFRQEAIVLGTSILTALGLALFFNLKAISVTVLALSMLFCSGASSMACDQVYVAKSSYPWARRLWRERFYRGPNIPPRQVHRGGEAYIASQRHEGWTLVPDAYDDGGFTGGNMERPALRKLMADIEAEKVDCVVVYKVDRLSRSLLDFARIMGTFEKRGTSFVSVTQQFNTTASLGRLTLNILLSFAQFEREIIAERTRDKMSAARRKGKWVGGIPVLGYDVHPHGGRLAVNEDEAGRVRAIFDLYLEHRSLVAVARELNRRGWTTKVWVTKDGREHHGQPFTKSSLFRLLTNVIYTGQVNHKGTYYRGEHQPIVDSAVWGKVDERLRHNGITGGKEVRNKYGALLRGLLHCDACGTAMVHTYTVKNSRRYRYYVCLTAQQQGWDACPSKSLPAQRVEDSIVDRIRSLGTDPRIAAETARKVREQAEASSQELRSELKTSEKI